MRLEVLLSAMYLKNYKYIDSLNVKSNCVIINQTDNNMNKKVSRDGQDILYIETKERGLSKSRNLALKNSRSEICILCDNDIEYLENYEETILKEFEENPEFDVIIFHIERKKKIVPYYKKSKRMNYLNVLKVYSPEIAFRRDKITDLGLSFNEQFGAGAKFNMGEENIFLYKCLKKGIKILYASKTIAKEREEESTWFKGFTKDYFFNRGAIFYEMSAKYHNFLIFQFAIRKFYIYNKNFSILNAIQIMQEGVKEYKKNYLRVEKL